MTQKENQRVVHKNGLTACQCVQVEQLAARCNQHDGLDLLVNTQSSDQPNQLLCYDGDELIGFAYIQDGTEPEVYGMVHPEQRRKGAGRTLLSAIQAECRKRGRESLLLVCEDASTSGQTFAAAVGAQYRFSEYGMVLDPTAIDRTRPRHESLHLQPADATDIEALVHIKSVSFCLPITEVQRETTERLQAPDRQYYIGWLNGESIGTLRVGRYDTSTDITAFAVLPEHRGRGYGRQMLLDTIDILLSEGWEQITIEVVTENYRALGLYQSCGFQVAQTYGYYHLTLS